MKTITITSPYNNEYLGEVLLTDETEIEKNFTRLHTAYSRRDAWLKPHQRIAILEKFAQLLDGDRQTLALQATAEGGKPLQDSLIEVDRAINGIKIAIQTIPELGGKEIPMGLTPATEHRLAYTYREPIGVVLGISAFNHPVNLIIHQIIPAIACGSPVMIKPALKTPLSAIKLVLMLYEAGLPQEWCQLLLCDHQFISKIISDPRLSFLSFIGSSKVGWQLRSQLAPGVSCALEHGGSAPVIIEADARLDELLPLVIKGGFYHAGQVCVSVKRVYVHQAIIHEVANKLGELANKLTVGDPKDSSTEVGPIISTTELQRIDGWVQQAVTAGAQLLCGGKALSESCYAPTILLDPPQDTKVSQLEIFGPVICLYTYHDRLQAIATANSLPFCFQAAVFTQDLEKALDTVRRLNATAVMINDHTAFRADWMPFGGRQQSGLGMGGIKNSMHDMSVEKMFIVRSSVL